MKSSSRTSDDEHGICCLLQPLIICRVDRILYSYYLLLEEHDDDDDDEDGVRLLSCLLYGVLVEGQTAKPGK